MNERLNTKTGVLTIQCKVCKATFSLSVEEQKWYRSKGYSFPKSCYNCRRLARAKRNSGDGTGMLNILSDDIKIFPD